MVPPNIDLTWICLLFICFPFCTLININLLTLQFLKEFLIYITFLNTCLKFWHSTVCLWRFSFIQVKVYLLEVNLSNPLLQFQRSFPLQKNSIWMWLTTFNCISGMDLLWWGLWDTLNSVSSVSKLYTV